MCCGGQNEERTTGHLRGDQTDAGEACGERAQPGRAAQPAHPTQAHPRRRPTQPCQRPVLPVAANTPTAHLRRTHRQDTVHRLLNIASQLPTGLSGPGLRAVFTASCYVHVIFISTNVQSVLICFSNNLRFSACQHRLRVMTKPGDNQRYQQRV